MKKFVSFVLLMVIMITSAFGQPKETDKSLWKMAKKEAKKLEKEGWNVDSSIPLENVLFKHYQKLTDENNQELIANVIGNTTVTTMNQGQQWTSTMASVSYAKQAGQNVRGRIAAEVGAGTENMPSADSFYEGYESKVEKEIKGELKKSFSLYKEKSNGTIDYKAYYIVNEENASKARIRAMQLAIQESEFARQNAEKISEFVQQAFKIENE
jgi:Ca2+-binding EF-hand superfamily protein